MVYKCALADLLRLARHLAATAALTILISGCLRTTLEPNPLSKQELRLLSTNNKLVSLRTAGQDTPALAAGHQYLLVIIPFGSIEIPDLNQRIRNSAARYLAFHGYRLSESDSPLAGDRLISLSAGPLQLSAYDFLFVRRVYCSVVLRGAISPADGPPGREWQAEYASGYFARYAFEPQLRRFFDDCLDQAIKDVFEHLNIA